MTRSLKLNPSKMVPAKFRCPFEIKGEKEGRIIHVHLGEDQEARFELMKAAFKTFHADHSMVSIKFHLPQRILQVATFLKALKIYIVPYQADMLAAELDYRLYPFLSYQQKQFTKEEMRAKFDKNQYGFAAAYFLTKAIEQSSMPANNITDISGWIGAMMLRGYHHGSSGSIQIHDGKDGGNVYITISSGSATIHHEDFADIVGEGNDRKNCFGIVTCPLYPESFGRYSEDVVIVVSRMKDFTALEIADRRKIRYKSNTIYKNHGVDIQDLYEDKQPEGLWIP